MIITRRSILKALFVTPAIIKPDMLMPVKSFKEIKPIYMLNSRGYSWILTESGHAFLNRLYYISDDGKMILKQKLETQ